MNMRFLFLALSAAFAVQPADAPVHKFTVRVGRQLSGTEEFRSQQTATGFVLAGRSRLEGGGRVMELRHELALAPDRGLVSYRLEASGAGPQQLVEARREGEEIRMRASVGGQGPTSTAPFQARTVVLDNLVTAHYQGLLDGLPAAWEGALELDLLIPQRLAATKGKLKAEAAADGVQDGRPVKARKLTLEVGGLLIEIWAQAETGLLQRVLVPIQDVEITRAGFSLAPPPAAASPASACVERAVRVPSGGLELPGTLCVPAGLSGRSPAIVLVHGSGPHDRDESIGPNKPFRDLAEGLAAAGIATLRYDKRTFAFRGSVDAKATVEEEVLADAVAALRQLRSLPEIDAARTFLLGHSLGAMMAPFILERAPETRGAILMAAAGRPLDELVLEQIAFQMQAAGQPKEKVAEQVGKLRGDFGRVRSGAAPDSEIVFMAPALYWRDLLRRDHVAALGAVRVPVLVLQGGRDVQVKKQDFDLLVRALPAKGESRLFPELNHLFMPADAGATGAEYGRPGRVDATVIEAIARFVRKN